MIAIQELSDECSSLVKAFLAAPMRAQRIEPIEDLIADCGPVKSRYGELYCAAMAINEAWLERTAEFIKEQICIPIAAALVRKMPQGIKLSSGPMELPRGVAAAALSAEAPRVRVILSMQHVFSATPTWAKNRRLYSICEDQFIIGPSSMTIHISAVREPKLELQPEPNYRGQALARALWRMP